MSSANRRLVIFRPPMPTFPSCSSRALDKNVEEGGREKASFPKSNCCSESFSCAVLYLSCTFSLFVELLDGAN